MSFAKAFLRFLSTPSARRATQLRNGLYHHLYHFYPRPPRGGRRPAGGNRLLSGRFLSTPSARRATCPPAPVSCTARIFLSTPSARRATRQAVYTDAHHIDFYPRPPRGGRRHGRFQRRGDCIISIHALREEGDTTYQRQESSYTDFYPRPPRGGRPLLPYHCVSPE